jgi:hypothetical protein
MCLMLVEGGAELKAWEVGGMRGEEKQMAKK